MKALFFKASISSLAIMIMTLATSQSAPEAKPALKASTKAPAILAPYFTKDKPIMGEVGAVVPPMEINKYLAKVDAAYKDDPVWHKEYAKKSKPGLPLPWHEKLGITKTEYEEYLKFWDQRKFKGSQKVVIRLEEPKPGEWMIRVNGPGMAISLLRYYPELDQFKSMNGEMKRIQDINADARSILGAWTGQEWRYEQKTEFEWTTENLAIGKEKDGKHCLLIYRIEAKNADYDKSLVIRFAAPVTSKSAKKK